MNTTPKAGRSRHQLMFAVALGALTGVGAVATQADAAIGTPPGRNAENPSGLADLLRQARQAMSQGHPNVAIIYLKNAAALAPKNTAVRVELGYAYLKSGDPTAAVRELRAARQAGAPDAQVLPVLFDAMLAHNESQQLIDQFPAPKDGDHSPLAEATFRARSLALARTGHLSEAVDSIEHALAIKRDAANLVVRAQLAKDQNDLPTALKLSDEAHNQAPKDLSVLILRIALLQTANQPEQALNAANELVKLQPANPVSLLSRAGVYLQMKQDAKARADVDAVLAKWQNLPQAMYYKALLLERAKDTKGAWNIAQALPPEFINSRAEIGIMTARMAMAASHDDVAVTILAGTVSRFPDATEPRIVLASQYLRMKNAQRALDVLQPLRDSDEPRAMVLLGQAYALQKQYAKSTEYFEKASSAGFGGDLLKRQIAAGNLQKGDYDAAIKQLREIYEKQPADQVTASMLITALIRNNDLSDAGSVATKFSAAASKSAYGPLFQGQVLVAKGDFNGAADAFSRSITLDPKFIIGFYDRAIARAGKGDLAGANADLDTVLKLDPKNVMAMIRSAEVYIRMGQTQKAESVLRHAVSVDPKNSVPNLALASFYISHHELKQAGATINGYLRVAPGDLNAQMVQAEIQLANGQPDPALSTFRRLASQRPNSPQIQLMLASALVAKKDIKGAQAAYKRSLQLSPKFSLARSSLIKYALATNNPDLALSTAEEGTKVDPGSPSDLMLASTLVALKKKEQAESVLRKSLIEHPSEAGTVFYSQLLRQANKVKQSDQVLDEWIAKHPKDIGARLEIAQQQMQSNPVASEQQFRAVLQVQPNNTVALNNLSWLLQKKDPQKAIYYAEQALKQAPNSAPILDTLGWVKWQAKDSKGALSALQKAHSLDPNNPEIAYHLAVLFNANGRRAEAKKTLAGVLASNQEFSERREAEALNMRLQ